MNLPIRITPDLSVSFGNVSVRLTPRESLLAAERLVRLGMRRMIIEETQIALQKKTESDR